ncbi:MAG: type IVB secretion system protein IcmH/DotU [Gammaproteobacteria bacterium]|nr:type IVB secretion system protein IcmH/DotU [Gammaproteobacteria bacterium]
MPTQNGNPLIEPTSSENHFIAFPTDQTETTTLALPKDALINQLALPTAAEVHQTESGINPLVDHAARLFSLAGKLERLHTCRNPKKLQQEIIVEVNLFEQSIKSHGYSAEYLLVSRYAICATIDDILSHTEWGIEGQWEPLSLLRLFNQEEADRKERFFLILERLVKEPKKYIDLMEFMYVCLCLGFKGSYRATSFTHIQLDMICETVYQHIRTQRGEFSKILSPFSIKSPPPSAKITAKHFSPTLVLLITACTILLLFVGLNFILNTSSHHVDEARNAIEKMLSGETTHV